MTLPKILLSKYRGIPPEHRTSEVSVDFHKNVVRVQDLPTRIARLHPVTKVMEWIDVEVIDDRAEWDRIVCEEGVITDYEYGRRLQYGYGEWEEELCTTGSED